MKYITILTPLASLALLLASCAADNDNTYATDDTQTVQLRCTMPEPVVDVTPLSRASQDTPLSRASLTEESISELWVWEGTTLVKHQTNADADFGQPSLALDYGQHTLTIVASKATEQSWAKGVWTTNSAKECYGKVVELEVKKGMTAQDVELSRVTAKVTWTIEDAIPATCTTAACSVGSFSSLTAALAGADGYTLSNDFAIATYQGSKNISLSISLLPAMFGSECQTSTSITLKDASGNAIVKYEKDVPVLSNRVTNIHGEYFGTQGTGAITVSTAWLTPKDVEL